MLLIRFIRPKKSFVRDFKRGDLFFSPLSSFIEEEKNSGVAKWGDKREGQIHNILDPWKAHPKICDEKGNFLANLDPSVMKLSVKSSLNQNQLNQIGIVCFTVLRNRDFDKLPNGKWRIKDSTFSDLEKMHEGIRIPYVIFDVDQFERELKNKGLIYSFVHYYDPKGEITNFAWNEIYHGPAINLAFQKEKKFKYQREFRVVKDISAGQRVDMNFVKNEAYRTNMYWLKHSEFKVIKKK